MTSTAKFSYDTSSGTVTATFSAASIAGTHPSGNFEELSLNTGT